MSWSSLRVTRREPATPLPPSGSVFECLSPVQLLDEMPISWPLEVQVLRQAY